MIPSWEVTDFTIDGECSNCGECCSNILPLTEEEIETIKKYIKEHNVKEAVNGIPLDAQVNMLCPFMDSAKEHKCKIYHIRPKICRYFYCNKTPTMEEAKEMLSMDLVNMRKTFFREE